MANIIAQIKHGDNGIIRRLSYWQRKEILSLLHKSKIQDDIFVCEQIRYFNLTGNVMEA